MRLHYIGHASWLIESTDRRILIDPVLWDPHYEGLCAVSPRRHVWFEKLPAYDLIVISHRHFDHFDIMSLAALDRRCQILIPDRDRILAWALQELGFKRVEALPDNYRWVSGETSIITTPSAGVGREFGFLVQDSNATVWNQVDTVIDGAAVSRIASLFGPIDFLLANWQPLLESEVFTNGRTSFPYETYFRLLSNVKIANPVALAPASCGFKYLRDFAWLNKFVFPVTRDAFRRDVRKLLPGVNVMLVNPGDVVHLDSGIARHGVGESDFVSMVEDDTCETIFNPVGRVPELVDPNESGHSETEIVDTIEAFLRDRLAAVLKQSLQQRTIIHEYTKVGFTYRLDIVLPSTLVSYSIRFAESEIKLTKDRVPSPNLHTQIAGSVLMDLLLGRRSLSYLYGGGFYRSFNHVYTIEEHGCYRWKPGTRGSVADPLLLALDSDDLMMKYIDHAIRKNTQSFAAP